MKSITVILSEIVSESFGNCGYEKDYGTVSFSKTKFCQFQCNGSMIAAKKYKLNPLIICEQIKKDLHENINFISVEVAKPGFININLNDDYISEYASEMLNCDRLGMKIVQNPFTIVIDFGGPNVAKPLHVGHLRSAIIGESLKRISLFIGHNVIGDVHIGDWGLQMGMIIAFLKRQHPSLPYFDSSEILNSPLKNTITIYDLESIYPKASALSKSESSFLNEARLATFELQNGNYNYKMLWKHIVNISIEDLKRNYERLNVTFDVWKGESDSQYFIPQMVENLKNKGYAYISQGALVVDVTEKTDNTDIPPLILYKSDGAVLYSTTDLATIIQRKNDYSPDYIFYVVDKRQATHFQQVFRCAYQTGMIPDNLKLEHIQFGTMNGKDGKPFKTREGGVMKLSDLIETLILEAKKRLQTVNTSNISHETERENVSEIIAMAALKFGDLINSRESDYIFDIEKFCSFEGKTGPYLLYSVVRIKAILTKVKALNIKWNKISAQYTKVERELLIKIFEFQDIIQNSFEKRQSNLIAEYVYSLSNIYNSFYHENHVINESNLERQSSLIAVMSLSLKTMEICLELLCISTPERM